MKVFNKIGELGVTTVLFLTVTVNATAGLAPDFLGNVGGTFNYNLIFTTLPGEERLEAGNGMLTPGAQGSQDFLTIYDIAGFVSATAGPGWSVMAPTLNLGINGPQTAPNDAPGVVNVTFRYNGPNVTVDTVFTGFSIVSTFTALGIDDYTSQRVDNLGLDINQKIGEVGTTTVPAPQIPEPATMTLVGAAGLLGLASRFRRA